MNLNMDAAQTLFQQIIFELKQAGDISLDSDDSDDLAYEIVSKLREKGYFISTGLI